MRAGRESAARRGGGGRRFRAWLACFSLLLQLAATAGHFHREDFAFLAAGQAAMAADAVQGTPAQPRGQPTLPAHDDCSLCFSLQLFGASAPPAPVILAAPGDVRGTPALPLPTWRLASPAHVLFHTRAPPIV